MRWFSPSRMIGIAGIPVMTLNSARGFADSLATPTVTPLTRILFVTTLFPSLSWNRKPVTRVEHNFYLSVVGLENRIAVGHGAGLAITVDRDVVGRDVRIPAERRGKVMRTRPGNIELYLIAVVNVAQCLQ